MNDVILRSTLVTVGAIFAFLFLTMTIVPAMGDKVAQSTWLVCMIAPLLTALPVSFYTFRQGQRLKTAHRDLARAHAQLAAAHRRLAEKARHDDMTGLLNREAFFKVLDESRLQADRGALLIIDADHFKSINDRFGHLAGDEALTLIASAIASGMRSDDIIGRIGGEEFGAFLVGADETDARHIAERIRSEVERIRFRPCGQAVGLTVSIGGTVCREGAAISELIRSADERLYQAKHGGRNLTVLSAAA